MAWLHAVPEKRDGDNSKAKPKSRLQKIRDFRKDQKYHPEVPEVEGCQYLVGYLWEIGPTQPAGMGEGQISHAEIMCWQQNTGIDLDGWTARALRQLSGEYIAEKHKAADANAPAPWPPGQRDYQLVYGAEMEAEMDRLADI